MNEPDADGARPPVPVGIHRRRRRQRALVRRAIWAGWFLTGLSVILAIFVHKGLLGIAGLVGAVAVAFMMLRPSKLRRWSDPDVTEEWPD